MLLKGVTLDAGGAKREKMNSSMGMYTILAGLPSVQQEGPQTGSKCITLQRVSIAR